MCVCVCTVMMQHNEIMGLHSSMEGGREKEKGAAETIENVDDNSDDAMMLSGVFERHTREFEL